MKFTLDGSFTTLNDYIKAERSSKFAAADIKRIETTRVMWLCKEIGIKKITTPVKIKFTWFTKDERIDPDNTSFAKKFILCYNI